MMKNNKIKPWMVVSVLIVTALAMGVFFFSSPNGEKVTGDNGSQVQKSKQTKKKNAKKKKRSAKKAKKPSVKNKPVKKVVKEKLSPEDRMLSDAIDKASDSENLKDLISLSSQVCASKNPDIRLDMVNALSWFGKDALAELAMFAADPDEDVATEATNAIESGLGEIEDESQRLQQVSLFMKVFRNEGSLDMLAHNLMGSDDEALAVECIIDVINGGNEKAIEKAKEAYEFISGEEYTSAEDAIKYADEWRKENSEESSEE